MRIIKLLMKYFTMLCLFISLFWTFTACKFKQKAVTEVSEAKLKDSSQHSSVYIEKQLSYVEANTVTQDTVIDYTLCDSLVKRSSYFWKKKDSILQYILSENDKTLSETNKNFLKNLLKPTDSLLSFQKPLTAVFRLPSKGPGILSNSFHEFKEDGTAVEYYPEKDIIELRDTLNYSHYMEHSIYREYTGLLDSLGITTRDVYTYGINFQARSRALEVARQYSECEQYTFLPLDTTRISIDDKVLLSSTYDLDLEFMSNASIDSIQKHNPIHSCWDCPNSADQEKVFARLRGTKNVYFTYADTFPYNYSLDTPSRGLIYFTDQNEIIYLWSDSLDLFGCSCL